MIPSPCNKICMLNEKNVCVGCGRTRSEIARWTQLSEGEKQRVVRLAQERLATLGDAKSVRK